MKTRPYQKQYWTVEIHPIGRNTTIGYAHGDTLEKARIEARKKIDASLVIPDSLAVDRDSLK